MGIGGHKLGPVKLRRLSRLTGLPLEWAYIRNKEAGGVTIENGRCVHWVIDPATGSHERFEPMFHWASCPARKAAES